MINQEEYEILKKRDDKFRWVARDGNTELWVYTKKPYKGMYRWDSVGDINLLPRRSKCLFQFIQWGDEEPYSIAELIKEYDKNQPYEIFNRELESLYEESEETEVKKDIEWAKKEIKELMTEESQNYPHDEMVEKEIVLGILNQLDEPEKVAVPKFVAEWLTEDRDDSLYGLLERVNHLVTTDYKWHEWWEREVKGETFSEVQSIIAKAVINGYKVEKEPKYYVLDNEDRPLLIKFFQGVMRAPSDIDPICEIEKKHIENIQFTEQEIKDYDSRYWAFAVPVEEVSND